MTSKSEEEKFLLEELEEIKEKVPEIENVVLNAAVPNLVRAEIKISEHKQVSVLCLFQPSYPVVPLVTEVNSKYLAYKFLSGLSRLCDAECQKLQGQRQVVHVIQFVKTFLEENPLSVCSEEISKIKKLCTGERDEVKLKQKHSQVIFKVFQAEYFLNLRISVPDEYPLKQVVPEITEHNFPNFMGVNFQAQAVEIARQCVHPPLKKKPKDPPFVLKPSFEPVCNFLIKDCIKKYPLESCPLCKEMVLPEDPETAVTMRGRCKIERMYCGHLFHFICLHKYMKTPPFKGKVCSTCEKPIFHEKWKVTAEVLEQRWAHKEAKQRELEEVQDFLE